MKSIHFALAVAIVALFCSCSDDKVKSSQNYIEKFSLPAEINPVQINIINEQNLVYVLTNSANYKKLSTIEPIVECSKDASIKKEGENWTTENFKYVITAENGDVRSYSVHIDTTIPKKYSFESWTLSNGYYIPSDLRWASGNAGISMALAILGIDNKNPENYPTRKTSDGYIGNAVVLETIKGGNVFGRNVSIISGNFFLGNFNAAKAITDELAATEVGNIYSPKPKKVNGFYKYKEGPGDFSNKGTPEPGRRDSCNLHISFYQGDSPSSGRDTILTIRDIDTSELVIADATMADCSETAGNDFHPFTLDFGEYRREPDFENHYYKIAIIFAASRGGATYEGKIGSNLIVDEVEIEDY